MTRLATRIEDRTVPVARRLQRVGVENTEPTATPHGSVEVLCDANPDPHRAIVNWQIEEAFKARNGLDLHDALGMSRPRKRAWRRWFRR